MTHRAIPTLPPPNRTPRPRMVAVADEGDLLVTVTAETLRSLVDIAHTQVDEIRDDEEAAGYGLSLHAAEHLAAEASRILRALDI